jgi:hypothetical protein
MNTRGARAGNNFLTPFGDWSKKVILALADPGNFGNSFR